MFEAFDLDCVTVARSYSALSLLWTEDTKIKTHMCVDGLCESPVPIVDDAVDLWLDQQLRPLTSLQLREEKSTSPFTKKHHVKMYTGWSTVKPDSSSNTSMTCFLLDLSLEAHSTDPPRRSMVNSGFDWLLPNFWNQGNCMRLHVWHTDNITRTRCCFLCDFLSSVVLKAQTLNLLYGACHILKCWKLLWNSSCKHTSLV